MWAWQPPDATNRFRARTRDIRRGKELPRPRRPAQPSPNCRNAQRDSGLSGTRSRGCAPAAPAAPATPAAGRGRPRATKRRGRWRVASVRRWAAGTRRDRRGQGRSGHSAERTNLHERRDCSLDSGPAPTDQPPPPPAQPIARPGLPMAPEAGAPPCARRLLPWAALLLLAALVPVVSVAGAPGTRRRGWAAGSLRLLPASLSTSAHRSPPTPTRLPVALGTAAPLRVGCVSCH